MFKFKTNMLSVKDSEISLVNNVELKSDAVKSFLKSYEEKVYNHVKEGNKSFKYIQGQLPHSFFKNAIKNLENELKIYNLTQHPNFVGGIVINDFLRFNASEDNFILTYENPLAEKWLNSKVNYMDVVDIFSKLALRAIIKNDINIVFIRICDSTLIKFRQINLGASKPRYELK